MTLHVDFSVLPGQEEDFLHVSALSPRGAVRGVVVFVAGFESPGFESRRIFVDQARSAAGQGLATILFDYRGYGYSSGRFENTTFQSQCFDLLQVIQYARNRWPGVPLFAWAASFGCAVTAHAAARGVQLSGAVFWGLSADLYSRYTSRYAHLLNDDGWGFTDKGSKITRGFLESLQNIDTIADIASTAHPILLVHGNADSVAPIELSRRASQSRPEVELVEVMGGNHGFKAQVEQYAQASSASLAWLERTFS